MSEPAFDIAVLMGSQSPTVFDEYCAMHRGARRLRKLWETRCKCGEPDCFRRGVNELSDIVHYDQEILLGFLDSISEGFEPLTFEEFEGACERMMDACERKHGKFDLSDVARIMGRR